MSDARRPDADTPSRTAYIAGLAMLARRELTEVQVRQRLARKGHPAEEVDEAIDRLKAERALDDRRVADALARTSTTLKRRGRLRVRRELEQAGIAPALAREATESAFSEVDGDALIEAALARRLRGGRPIEDAREFQRLYRYLVAQGFESDRVLALLGTKRRRGGTDDLE